MLEKSGITESYNWLFQFYWNCASVFGYIKYDDRKMLGENRKHLTNIIRDKKVSRLFGKLHKPTSPSVNDSEKQYKIPRGDEQDGFSSQ